MCDDLRALAERFRWRFRRDGNGDPCIQGRHGQVYEFAPGRFAALYMPTARGRRWLYVRRVLVQMGCEVVQDGDSDGCVLLPVSAEPALGRALARLFSIRVRRADFRASRPFGAPRGVKKAPDISGNRQEGIA